MDEEEFIETVRRELPLESTDTVREVTTATLRTLGERITDGEAADLAQYLPDTLTEALLDAPGEAEPFSLDEFTGRVSDRAGVDESDAVAGSGPSQLPSRWSRRTSLTPRANSSHPNST